ncbi:MAG: hypothetical protein AB7O52_19400 [Planctomycetota bacterium]
MDDQAEIGLDDYVQQTLLQIFNGIVEANEKIASRNSIKENTFGLSPGQKRDEGQGIEFDLSLAVRKSTGGWSVKVVNVGVDRGKSGENEFASRVQFTVSVDRWVREGASPVRPLGTRDQAGGEAQAEQQRIQQQRQQQQ